ncbi:Tetratricopeptide repeat-containing protein [Salegentibacter holothuriorum]|uniref:Tetratricopeptide repeat-containing protein n=1 Tax=Salegentibacter holothuriorum TaxID=241145 RepID=A0A1T5E2J4_9FLAO|nr:tetratricopeptide repeat protein [Salegentibacter holothuriorum]SKB78020.1 Tetratricopeptide repeat-containing protein [Salegentibacter holothuriorum]
MTRYIVTFLLFVLCFLPSVEAQTKIEVGENFLNQHQIKRAKNVFEELSNNKKAIEYLGDIASFEKRWDDAIKYYEELVENDPDSAVYNFKLGGALGMKAMEASKFKAALMVGDIKTYLNKTAELDKNHSEVRRALVELYMQLPSFIGGDEEIAQQYVNELKSINKVDAYLAQAYINKAKDEQDEMQEAVSSALHYAQNNPKLIERNYLNYELGERAATLKIMPDAAIHFLQKYTENYNYKDLTSPAWAHYHIAKMQVLQNNQDKALNHVNKALAVQFNFPEAEKLKRQILEM